MDVIPNNTTGIDIIENEYQNINQILFYEDDNEDNL